MALAPVTYAQPGGVAAAFDGLLGPDGYPSPRVAAAAVIALLGFGALIGSVVGGAGAPLWVLPVSTPVAQVAPTGPEPAAAPAADVVAEVPAALAETPAAQPTETTGVTSTAVKHVWLIVLSGQGYANSFGNPDSTAYLVNTLASQGAVVENYFAVARGELANTVALISGQGPTWQIADNCPVYSDIAPATIDAVNAGQVTGDGCVFPETTKTIGDALTGVGKTWSIYAEDADSTAAGRTGACQVPAAGAQDPSFAGTKASPYTTWSNPFLYFKSLAASPNCQFTVFGLGSLKSDLAAEKSPAFSMVVPNRCHSGGDTPCETGEPAGLPSSDEFLKTVVGQITASKDYADGGLIAITFDQAPRVSAGEPASCCGQPLFPNLQTARQTAPTGQTGATASAAEASQDTSVGGGKVGLLLLSPNVQAGSVDTTGQFNHFSLLLSIENWFGAEKLGYSAASTLEALPDELVGIESGSTGATGK